VSGRCSLKRVVHPGDFRHSESSSNKQSDRKGPNGRAQECAKLPGKSRVAVETSLESGWSLQKAAEAAGLSARRAREWVRRGERDEPMTGRSSRPHRCSTVSSGQRRLVVALRRTRMTERRIAVLAGVSLFDRRADLPARRTASPEPDRSSTAGASL